MIDKQDTMSVAMGSPHYHGIKWRVTLNGEPVDQVIEASRKHGYLIRYAGRLKPRGNETETLRGLVDYEPMP